MVCNVENCNNNIFQDNRCVLHCKKNTYQIDRHSGLLSNFYKKFKEYIINELYRYPQISPEGIDRDDLIDYLDSNTFDNQTINAILKNTIFIPTSIHFPERDSRDYYDYLKLLNLFGQIHFNYCEFYISYLKINQEIECFFQDCKFHTNWTLYDYELLENQDNVIYQTCEFFNDIYNYSSEDKKISIFNHSQFDYTCIFKKNINLYNSKFKSKIFNTNQGNYNKGNHIINISFNNCEINQKFMLNDFLIDKFVCKHTIFNDKFEFKKNTVQKIDIYNSNFFKLVDFYGSNFEKSIIGKSIFEDFVGFEKCKFGNEKMNDTMAIFKYVTFLNFVNFRKTEFNGGLDLQDINLKEAPNFLGVKVNFKNTNRETFRIIKHSFDKIGNYIDGNKFFSLEMKKYRETLKQKPLLGNFQEKLVFYFNESISNFGQSYLKPIFWIIILSIIYYMIILGYEKNLLYNIYEPFNDTIEFITFHLNNATKNILPFKKILKENMEFVSLLFYILYSILIWQTIVALKRYTKR
jgi:hypothetical protein